MRTLGRMKYGWFPALLLVSSQVLAGPDDALASRYEYGSCLVEIARAYGISPRLIDAIIRAESDHNPLAIHVNTSGSEDVGLMQINSQWLPKIEPLGYDRASLFEPCVNIQVGVWILAQEIQHFGYTWTAVGAYNAGRSSTPAREQRRSRYALRVFSLLDR